MSTALDDSVLEPQPTRLAQMRARAAARVEEYVREVAEATATLERAKEGQRIAERELIYWTNVREPDEVLNLCLAEGTAQTIVHGQDIVRDGREIRVCMERRPCPVHGRPLGDSDWRLHPVNGTIYKCPIHKLTLESSELCPRCRTDGESAAATAPLPTPSADL